jgi:centromere protein S
MSSRDRSDEDEMRAALQVAVAQICTSEDASRHDGAQMTSSAIRTLTELTYLYATTSLANDLVAFSQHASRRTITPDDVLLVARKNPDTLVAKMKDFAACAGLVQTLAVSATSKTNMMPNKVEASIKLPSRKKLSKSSSSVHRQLRERLLQGTDSENSSDDSNNDNNNQNSRRKIDTSSNALLETDSDENNVKVGVSTRPKRKPSCSKRKVIETDSSDANDDPQTARSMKKGKVIPTKKTITTHFSSDDDSSDF